MRRKLSMEDLPVWLWSTLVTEDSFVQIPPNFTWPEEEDEPEEEIKAAATVSNGEKKETPLFRYAKVETQYCVDSELGFCESLAVVYSRILEGRGEKIFLRGNAFAAKIAKAVFEQNGNLFADACMKHKDEKYFRECMDELDKMGFAVEKDGKADKNSWLGLYDTVLLLTGEYLATKCDLPKVSASECKENSDKEDVMEIVVAPQSASEGDIKNANLAPLELEREGMYDSSDSVKAGDLFYEFLCKNFPFKDNEEELAYFMNGVYGENACEDLGWFCKAASDGSLPRPEIKIEAMEDENMLGDHDGESICVNQRLVLDALRDSDSGFILFVIMLIEYGHFLGQVLHEKAGESSEGPRLAGRDFAYSFMECSEANLFSSDFEFADFISSDAKGKEQKLVAGVSGLSGEQKKDIFYSLGSESIWEGEV